MTDYQTLQKLFEAAMKQPDPTPVRGNASHHLTRPGHAAPGVPAGQPQLRIQPVIKPSPPQRPQGH